MTTSYIIFFVVSFLSLLVLFHNYQMKDSDTKLMAKVKIREKSETTQLIKQKSRLIFNETLMRVERMCIEKLDSISHIESKVFVLYNIAGCPGQSYRLKIGFIESLI